MLRSGTQQKREVVGIQRDNLMNIESAREGAFKRRESFKKNILLITSFLDFVLKKITPRVVQNKKLFYTHTQSRPFVTSLISYSHILIYIYINAYSLMIQSLRRMLQIQHIPSKQLVGHV